MSPLALVFIAIRILVSIGLLVSWTHSLVSPFLVYIELLFLAIFSLLFLAIRSILYSICQFVFAFNPIFSSLRFLLSPFLASDGNLFLVIRLLVSGFRPVTSDILLPIVSVIQLLVFGNRPLPSIFFLSVKLLFFLFLAAARAVSNP
jgi:hypothetical protein